MESSNYQDNGTRPDMKVGTIHNTKYGTVMILSYVKWEEVVVVFTESGNIISCCMSQLRRGTLKDTTVVSPTPKDMETGAEYNTPYGKVVVITYYGWDKVSYLFPNTGTTGQCRADDLRSGSVRDKYGVRQDTVDSFIDSTRVLTNSTLAITGFHSKGKFTNNLYSVSCSKCSPDLVLHPVGFTTTKSNWDSGCIPCPCSNAYKWEEREVLIMMKRCLDKKGLVFKGLVGGEYLGANDTYVKVFCNTHDRVQETSSVSNILQGSGGCNVCATFKARRSALLKRWCFKEREVFYILKFTHKTWYSFIKTGICVLGENTSVECAIRHRYRGQGYFNYTYDIMYSLVGEYMDIANLEIDTQEINYENRVKLPHSFVGYTECYSEFFYEGESYY